MRRLCAVALLVAAIRLTYTAGAQEITIDSISQDGSISFCGARTGTQATVEWAASLTDTGRTNWIALTNILVTSNSMTSDIPMFFRIRGQPDTPVTNGLLAYYPFNGNANDESGNAHNGVVSGATLTTNRFGVSGKAYAFNGAGDYINCGRLFNRYDIFSYSMWYEHTNLSQKAESLIENRRSAVGSGDSIGIISGSNMYGSLDRDSPRVQYIVTGKPADLAWHHVVLTCDGLNLTIYCDGALTATTPMPAAAAYSSQDLWIGRGFVTDPDGYGLRAFSGLIDEVRIYDRALLPNEVMKLYQLPY